MNGIIVPILFAVYIYLLIKVILFKFGTMNVSFLGHQLQKNIGNPENIIERLRSGNFSPFKEISRNIHGSTSHDFINLVGNVALFMPLGIFLLLMSRNKQISFVRIFIISLGLSLSLECSQVIFLIGTFDVDDLILNVSGGVLGVGLYKIYAMSRRKRPRVANDKNI